MVVNRCSTWSTLRRTRWKQQNISYICLEAQKEDTSLNNQQPSVQFTMAEEENGRLAFLDVLVIRPGDQLVHNVYKKATHTDIYLNQVRSRNEAQSPRRQSEPTKRAEQIFSSKKYIF